MKRTLPLLCLFLMVACNTLSDHQEGPYLSPDGTLELYAKVNRTDPDQPNYAKVVFSIVDNATNQTLTLETGIGDAMKWSVGWYDDDTIVAYSSDIGTHCWRFDAVKFEELQPTREMQLFAEQVKGNKYRRSE